MPLAPPPQSPVMLTQVLKLGKEKKKTVQPTNILAESHHSMTAKTGRGALRLSSHGCYGLCRSELCGLSSIAQIYATYT